MTSEPNLEVRITPQAERVYRRLDRAVRKRVDAVLEQLASGNFTSHNIVALHGKYAGSLRYRLGEWRIIFSVDRAQNLLWVEAISTRGGAYRS